MVLLVKIDFGTLLTTGTGLAEAGGAPGLGTEEPPPPPKGTNGLGVEFLIRELNMFGEAETALRELFALSNSLKRGRPSRPPPPFSGGSWWSESASSVVVAVVLGSGMSSG